MTMHNQIHPVHLFFFVLFILTALICVFFIIKKVKHQKGLKLLEKEKLNAAMIEKMQEIPNTDPSVFNIWPYVSQLKATKILSHKIKERDLIYKIYRDSTQEFEHILLSTEKENNFVVLVVDKTKKKMMGYSLLDLNKEL